jgi:hypothetical protein
MKGFVGVYFVCVWASIAPVVFFFICTNGAVFLSDELHSFLGFLPGMTDLVRVTGSILLLRQKCFWKVLMFLFFANVAES